MPRSFLVLFFPSLVAFIGTASTDAGNDRPKHPNVLLITSEDHGPHLSCYGDPNIRTPNLDRLASQGVRFANAYVTYSVCSPSRGSILTGLYAHQNGQIGLATHKFAMYRHWPNIPSLLKKAGYRTGIIGKLHVNPARAFSFDFKALSGSNFRNRPMRKFADLAGRFMRAADKPFFLMVNYPDAHFPLLKQQHGLPKRTMTAKDVKRMLPEVVIDTPRLRKHAADYYNCLLRLDAGIGMLLTELSKSRKADRTLVIYLSDHGAQFSRGKTTCYEGGLRVPMMIRWPKRIPTGQVRKELVSSIDILPTILAATGVKSPANLPGRSLLALGRDGKTEWRRYLFTGKAGSTAFWTFPQRTVRDERHKLILNLTPDRSSPTAEAYEQHWGSFFVAGCTAEEIAKAPPEVRRAYAVWKKPPAIELYDLKTDPHELRNLAGKTAHAKTERRLLDRLRRWQQETNDPFANKKLLAKYLAETSAVTKKYGGAQSRYRRDRSFRWRYLTYLVSRRPFTSPRSDKAEFGYGLSQKEARAGWISLFDGKSTYGWNGASVENGHLRGGTTTTAFGDVDVKAAFTGGGTIRFGSRPFQVKGGKWRRVVKGNGRGAIRLGKSVAVQSLIVRPLGMKSVFNGKDLSGWKVLKHPRRKTKVKWSITGCAIRAVGGPGALELQQRYGDLVLQLDVRTTAPLANGGVFFRCIPGDFMNGYEAQVFNACYDNDPCQPARYSTGGIDDRQLARRLISRDGKVFTMTVIATGTHIATWVNGYQLTDWTDTRKKHENPRNGLRVEAGTIQLQAHDPKTAVEFSALRVGTLPDLSNHQKDKTTQE